MAKKKTISVKNKSLVNEPLANYRKEINFFKSFEEEEVFTAKKRASQSYDERMENIEALRKIVYNNYLQPDGTWPSIKRVYEFISLSRNEIS